MRTLLVVITIFLGVTFANAQPWIGQEPCLPDCNSSAWGANQKCTLSVNNTCTVVIDFRVRFACSSWYDVYIAGYTVTPATCGASNPAAFHADVTKALLESNCTGHPPTNDGDCEDNWRVSKGTCWVRDIVTGGIPGVEGTQSNDVTFWYACTTETCCLEKYTVCKANGVRTATFTGGNAEPCPQGTPPSCFPACQTIYR